MEAMFYSEQPQAHSVVELNEYLYVIVELTHNLTLTSSARISASWYGNQDSQQLSKLHASSTKSLVKVLREARIVAFDLTPFPGDSKSEGYILREKYIKV